MGTCISFFLNPTVFEIAIWIFTSVEVHILPSSSRILSQLHERKGWSEGKAGYNGHHEIYNHQEKNLSDGLIKNWWWCRYAGGSPDGVKAQVHALLLVTQCASGGYVVLAKNALSDGLHKLVFSVYRNAFGLILLIPFAFFYER